jgi:hypothetical protein
MNPLNSLFGSIVDAITNHASPNTPGPAYNANDILGTISSLFNQHAGDTGQPFNHDPSQYGNVQSSNQDQYGDPGNQQYGNVQSSNQDPYGDPGNQQYGNVKSSNDDPYGDPGRYLLERTKGSGLNWPLPFS